MKHTSLRHYVVLPLKKIPIIIAASMAMATLSWASDQSFSGPSIAKLANPVTFTGTGYQPNAALTIFIKAPSGETAGYGTTADVNGGVSYSVTPTQVGTYALTLTDSGGRTLSETIFLTDN